MRRRRYRSHDEEPKLMLSPMIDMMFLCLVFFIVSTMYMGDIRTIPVRLPLAAHSESVGKSGFSVTVKKDGSLYLDDKPMDMDTLVTNAALQSRQDASFSVIIRAEDDASYKTVVTLLDRLKGAGVSRFGLATSAGDDHGQQK